MTTRFQDNFKYSKTVGSLNLSVRDSGVESNQQGQQELPLAGPTWFQEGGAYLLREGGLSVVLATMELP